MRAAAEADLVERLRAGDEQAFVSLFADHNADLVRIAAVFAPSPAIAEEVVQEAWLAVVRGIEGFEQRSSLRTWLVGIVVNRAKTAGVRERRTVPVASVEMVRPRRGNAADGGWSASRSPWTDAVDDRIVARRAVDGLAELLADLPDSQRRVVILRDLEGRPSSEVCTMLDISEANQRVQLHRGRCRLRAGLAGVTGPC